MNRLTPEQQQSILDFYFRCGDQKEIEYGRDLIASNAEAAKLYADLETSLTDLDHIKYDVCPDNLVDLTVARLKLAAMSSDTSNTQLNQLLEKEKDLISYPAGVFAYNANVPREIPAKQNFLRPVFEVFAAAASIALVAGMLFPGLGVFRAHSRQVACERNLAQVGTAFASFTNDNYGRSSEAKVKAGSPWWKIGDQGQETQSNTRYPFMLIKQGYVDGRAFICKGDKQALALQYQPSMSHLNDFSSRNNISYSFMLFCDKSRNPLEKSRKIIASDLNPVFVSVFSKLPCEPDFYQKMKEFEKILLNEQIKQMMSSNHCGRGQNLLYNDGSVDYTKERIVNGDDIFTVRGIDSYTGCEIPAEEDDTFLAP